MIQNPILRVLSTFCKYKVKALLIGGQACIVYGAAEFSRDSDFVIFLEPDNIKNLKVALESLRAKQVFLPPLDIDYLGRGHACHFRCNLEEVKGLRIDIMAKLRGCGPFNDLWKRRKTINLQGRGRLDIISLKDLVQCKKTQRDKDWLMLKRLVEVDILHNRAKPTIEKLKWWFYECRTPELLIDLAREHIDIAKRCAEKRHLLLCAIKGEVDKLDLSLKEEELEERNEDRLYWLPLRKELEQLRRKR